MEKTPGEDTYVRLTPDSNRCPCECRKRKNGLLFLTLFLAVISLCMCAFLFVKVVHAKDHRCVLSEEDEKVLLMKLRSLEFKQTDEYGADVTAEFINAVQEGPSVLTRIGRAVTENKKNKRKQRKPKKRCPRHCRKRGKRGPPGPKGEPGPAGPPGPRGLPGVAARLIENKKTIKAAHFMPDFWKDRKDLEANSRLLCLNVNQWRGKACRNRTLEMTTGKLNFFHPAAWIEENEHITSPVTLDSETGEFVVTEEGLYLLYSSVTFYDSKLKESQALTVNGTKLFKCMEGVDYVDGKEDRAYNSKYRTCSITGVTYLKQGHRLAVVNLYNKTVIDMTKDSTFFGVVQLVPGPGQSTELGEETGTSHRSGR